VAIDRMSIRDAKRIALARFEQRSETTETTAARRARSQFFIGDVRLRFAERGNRYHVDFTIRRRES
jgi:hypothetical protein